MINVPNPEPSSVLSFVRQDDTSTVFVVLNLSDRPRTVEFSETLFHGHYTEFFAGTAVELDSASTVALAAWGYRVFVR